MPKNKPVKDKPMKYRVTVDYARSANVATRREARNLYRRELEAGRPSAIYQLTDYALVQRSR